MSKKQPVKTINPFIIKGVSSFYGMDSSSRINPFLNPEVNFSVLNVDTEKHDFCENKSDPETEEV